MTGKRAGGAPANWLDAFRRLDGQLGGQRKTVVLLDEVSWLGQYDGRFADDLKVAWDNWFKKHDRLVMVLCGSVSSWIRENVIDNTAKWPAGTAVRTALVYEGRLSPGVEADGYFDAMVPFGRLLGL